MFSQVIPNIQLTVLTIDGFDYFSFQNVLDNNLQLFLCILQQEVKYFEKKLLRKFIYYRYTANTFIFLIFIYKYFNTGHFRISLEVEKKCQTYLWFICKRNEFITRELCMVQIFLQEKKNNLKKYVIKLLLDSFNSTYIFTLSQKRKDKLMNLTMAMKFCLNVKHIIYIHKSLAKVNHMKEAIEWEIKICSPGRKEKILWNSSI